MALYESDLEEAVIEHLQRLGYTWQYGPDIAPEQPTAERTSYADVVLHQRLAASVRKLNPTLSDENLQDVLRRVLYPSNPGLVVGNQSFHALLFEGVPVEYPAPDGHITTDFARLVDWSDPWANDWLVVNQFTVAETGKPTRRPDIILFLNGLPIAIFELKNPTDPQATTDNAFQQLQTYKAEYPALFTYNELLVASDGLVARFGSLTAHIEWFLPWKALDGETVAVATMPEYVVMLDGLFPPATLLDYLHGYIVFEDDQGDVAKKLAGYHQYHAVRKAVTATVQAVSPDGDRHIGVVWHTQGSGKSLTMAFYAGQIIQHPALANPTLVVITDRNDLDDQLFGVFARCQALFRQTPVQADTRHHLRRLLQVASGGVIFTTMQKFLPEGPEARHPLLSDRHNIVVIADEAHRSQYDFIDGYARHLRDALPRASFIGFTGTPIEKADANTRAVFGDYISIYDIQRAVTDGASVPIYYESRLAQIALKASERPKIDSRFEEVTEGEEIERKEQLKTQWARLEAVVGAKARITLIARDLVEHFENRLSALDGKALVVCMSRRICLELYHEIAKIRPAWVGESDDQGAMKIVMTGSASDPLDWQPHIRNKPRREALAQRFRDPGDPFQIALVRDMWLTGFDAPSLHTRYMDKPMRGHGLVRAIASVNLVLMDKPGGLVVDYLGLAEELKQALATYTESGGQGKTAIDQDEAVAVLLKYYEICRGLFHHFDWSRWTSGTPQERLSLLPAAQEHILSHKDGKARLLRAVTDLSKAFALAVPATAALNIRDDVGFFQAVRAVLAKNTPGERKTDEELDHAIRQIISKAVASEGVVDIFAAAGLKKPDLSILSDEFLAEVRTMPQRHLAVELLQKLLKGEIKTRARRNAVQGRSFAELLDQAIRKYQNRAIETAQVIEELIGLAKAMRAAHARGEQLHLTEDELAFYDALEVNDSAVKVLGEPTLVKIARELVATVRKNVTIDWTVRENIRAQLRVIVKRILRKYGYPPDKQERATQTVLEQAELLSAEWALA